MSTPKVSVNDTVTVTTNAAASGSAHPTFQSISLWVPVGARGAFGGQIIAQALTSASRTVPSSLGLHSQHSYFLLPALPSIPIIYHVETLRDGKSYASRLVKACQEDKVIFVLTSSYTVGEIPLGEFKGGEIPFGFVPTMLKPSTPEASASTAPAKQEPTKISRSLEFAVETTAKGSTSRLAADLASTAPAIGQKKAGGVPVFRPRIQLQYPSEVIPFNESPLEEDRWSSYLQRKSLPPDDLRRRYIEEYIRVSAHVVHLASV